MSGSVGTLFTTYLLYPIIVLVLVVVGLIVMKKNNLLRNKRLISFALLSALVLAVPALLGFLGYGFMPYGYIVISILYFFLGWSNDRLLPWVFKKDIKYRVKIGFTLFQLVAGMLLFTFLFNLCSDLKFGIWASTSMLSFILASLLLRSYEIFIHIPALVYKVWKYDSSIGSSAPEDIDHSKLKVVTVELFKQETDPEPIRINAKVPDGMLFGDWVKLLFEDYNKKSVHSPIDVYGEEGCGWIFYIKSWVLAPRKYIDYELSVNDNLIKERHLIVAKRVKNITIQ